MRSHPGWFRSTQRHCRAGSFLGVGARGQSPEDPWGWFQEWLPALRWVGGVWGCRAGQGVWTGTGRSAWEWGVNENKWSDRVVRLRSRLRDPRPLSISNSGRWMRAENSHPCVSFTPRGLWTPRVGGVLPTCWPIRALSQRESGSALFAEQEGGHSVVDPKLPESCAHFLLLTLDNKIVA